MRVESCPLCGKQAVVREGQGGNEGKSEHPLHQCDHRITAYEVFEQHEIGGVAQLSQHDEHIAPYVVARSGVGATARVAADDEDECPGSAYGDAEHFLPRDGFVQVEGGQSHGEQGHTRRDDAGVDRRRQAHAEYEETLVEHNGQQ